jgi:hypothetical protein
MTSEFIEVHNNGKHITSTNYWKSTYSQNGYCYFTINAGCVRLLLPQGEGHGQQFDESVLDTTQHVIITRGHYQGRDAYEVLFEDGSSEPYVMFTLANQWQRGIPRSESGRTGIAFHVYRDGRLIRQLEARFREVETLPCLKPWK